MASDLIDPSDLPEYGPAMQALSPMMRAFVLAILDQRRRNNTAAARRAGYADNSAVALRVTGHRLAHDSRVIAALHEEAGKRMETAAHIAAGVVIGVMTKKDAKDKDVLKAAGMILDRTGYGAAQTINVNKTVTRKMDMSAAAAKIAEFRQKFPEHFARMVGVAEHAAPAVIDGEFTEVPK
jgi:phage terminase small subunit